jgi:prepilin-type N-terminal cleavage/methylation domain-containing protein
MASRQRGFTIIELMIAITVMGVSMLLVTMGVIQISRYYRQAQTKTELLNANRELHAKFGQDLQYSGYDPAQGVVTASGKDYTVICMGTTRYIVRNASFTDNYFGIDTLTGQGECSKAIVFANVDRFMPLDTRVTQFELSGSGLGPYKLETRFVAANGTDLFEGNDYNAGDCVSAAAGGQFCAVGALSSTLVRKVTN